MARMPERVEFTKEMKKDYTILLPNMATIHFEIVQSMLKSMGYHTELLTTTDRGIVDEGLKHVHNDTCYPALLSIGQMMRALHSGKYDLNKVALAMTQTGGGCRASNYIHLLRKALVQAGLSHIPVISISTTGMEKNSGFPMTLKLGKRAMAALTYGDLLMLLSNQTRPYEKNPGETDATVKQWITRIGDFFVLGKGYSRRDMGIWLSKIADSFASIPVERVPKTKVGIVGEIYVKYSPLANNHLEQFLAAQDCEVMVPGILGFLYYCIDNAMEDIKRYGGSQIKSQLIKQVSDYLRSYEGLLIQAVQRHSCFQAPWPHEKLYAAGGKVISTGCKMGEGWLLTAEMVELIEHGYGNIICTQPFGCLPNHIAGKGMIRKLKNLYTNSNIVAIDYDPGATQVNQENRIKLMLAVAREEKKSVRTPVCV